MFTLPASIKKSDKNSQESVNTPFSKFKRGILRRSRVSVPLWPKFEFLLDIMHVLDTFKCKVDMINSNREIVAISFLDAQGQL